MHTIHEAHEVARSYEVFTNPASYGAFDLTTGLKRIVGCIDPRDEETTTLKIIAQTGGGAAGKGFDASAALTAATGEVWTIEEGAAYDSDLQHSTVAGPHRRVCRFIYGLGGVVTEMTHPSDFTSDTFNRLVSRYDLKETGVQQNVHRIVDAAKRMEESIQGTDPEALIEAINALYPNEQNVRDMVGDNRAGFYILNHLPYAGLQRALVHRGENPLRVHAYHDSVRAMTESLAGTVGMPREVKDLRLAALMLRTAATRTVLCTDGPKMIHLNVVPTKAGVQIEEEHL